MTSSDQILTTTDEPESGDADADADADATEAADTLAADGLPTLQRTQQASVDARKRKFIDIPMV